MKKLYIFLILLLATSAIFAQCNIDTTFLSGTPQGMYPTANHLPHIVKDSLYDQTVQGKIETAMTFGTFGSATIDSVRLDSLVGLPAGITWLKSPNVLLGGGYGCVEFTGTTSDSAGQYNVSAFGIIWVHLSIPLLGVNKDTFQTGSLNRPPFNNFYLVVDSVQLPLSVAVNGNNTCYGQTNGNVIATAAGGSPTSPYSYIWSTGSTGYVLNNLGPGTYSVTAYSGTDSAIASYTVTAPSAPMTATTTTVGSNGTNGSAIITVTGGTPPYRYRWSDGTRSDTLSGVAPGTYTIRVTDSTGCVYNDSAVIADLTGIVSLNNDVLQLDMFPNPANAVLNIVIQSPKTLSLLVEAMDMTGRVVYSAPATVGNHSNIAINLDKFSPGMYILQLSSENQSVRQHFVVAH